MKKTFYSLCTFLFALLILISPVWGQSDITTDNKIGVVGGVVVIIFVLILLYLLRLEKKLSNLEKYQEVEE